MTRVHAPGLPWLTIWFVLIAALAGADPYTPQSDDEVLERLPPGFNGAELRRQRTELAGDKENLRDSVILADRYLDAAVHEGEPRYFRLAQAVLQPWWDLPAPPPEVLLQRARMRLAMFDGDRALEDVSLVLRTNPDEAEALQRRFEIEWIQARYADARATLEQMRPLLPPLSAATAFARLERWAGDPEIAAGALESGLQSDVTDDGARRDGLRLLADMDLQLGRTEAARTVFERLLSTDPVDVPTLTAFADCLLDLGDTSGVLALLTNGPPADAVRLRRWLALRALPSPDPAQQAEITTLSSELPRNFDTRRVRGDATALADESLWRLRIQQHPVAALEPALEQWRLCRDGMGARRVLEAASASARTQAAMDVIRWIRTNGIVDRRFDRWLASLNR